MHSVEYTTADGYICRKQKQPNSAYGYVKLALRFMPMVMLS